MFRSVHTGGGVYWDGLFSQNPPVRDLLDVVGGPVRPGQRPGHPLGRLHEDAQAGGRLA